MTISKEAYKRMDGLHDYRTLERAISDVADIFEELHDEGFEIYEIMDFVTVQLSNELAQRPVLNNMNV